VDIEYQPGKLTILLDNPRQKAVHRMDISSLSVLSFDDIKRLIQATDKQFKGKGYRTQRGCLGMVVSRFGLYMQQRGVKSLPDSFNSWQYLIFDWYAWYLSHADSTASVELRVLNWNFRVNPWLRGLMEEGLLPLGVVLPSNKFPDEVVHTGSPMRPDLIGIKPVQPTEKPINKTIAGPVFWRNDIEYLDEVESTLRQRNRLLAKVADDHLLRLVKDFRCGRNLMRRVSDESLLDRLSQSCWHTKAHTALPKFSYHMQRVTNPRMPNSDAWVLRIMNHLLETGDEDTCLSPKKLRNHPALTVSFLKNEDYTAIGEICSKTSLRDDQLALVEWRLLYMRFLGVLLPVDMAVACCILIQEHPNLNPESLFEAKLLNTRGKQFLVMTDEIGRSIFSVDKPRAGVRKYVPLTRRANRVMHHLLRATAQVRALLKRTGSKHWRYLFLGFSGGGCGRLGHTRIRSEHLTGNNVLSLSRLYPELDAGGLIKGTLDFAKIRTTQGMLEWFDSGSVHQVSRKLGNTYQVALEHYIPRPLIRLWNERIIRRFQNTLIALATHGEDYLLDVTDLRDYGELQEFIAQLVCENPASSSPIADEIDHRFGCRGNDNLLVADDGSLLTVRLDGHALALLYAFHRITVSRLQPEALQRPDSRTGLVPKHFVDLAALLAHAAENETVGEALRESLDLAKLKRAHAVANTKLPQILERLKHLYIAPTWSSP
jgi:hypothetical protein